jgi:hypothetical protein
METLSAVLFYTGLGLLVLGIVRITRASIERQQRDPAGIVSIVASIVAFGGAVVAFVHSARRVIPF